jgi:hypothetical protein
VHPLPSSTRIVAFIALVLAALGVVQAGELFQQNLLFTRAQTEVGFWGRGDYQPREATINRTHEQLGSLLRSSSAHPDYLGLQANAAAWQAYWSGTSGQQAVTSQYAALQSRPGHRYSWVKLAEYIGRSTAIEQNQALLVLAQKRLGVLSVKAAL